MAVDDEGGAVKGFGSLLVCSRAFATTGLPWVYQGERVRVEEIQETNERDSILWTVEGACLPGLLDFTSLLPLLPLMPVLTVQFPAIPQFPRPLAVGQRQVCTCEPAEPGPGHAGQLGRHAGLLNRSHASQSHAWPPAPAPCNSPGPAAAPMHPCT